MRIILATKQNNLRLAIELMLSEQPGIRVVGTSNHTEGLLALINSSKPDLILLDDELPGEPVQTLLPKIITSTILTRIILLVKDDEDVISLNQSALQEIIVKSCSPELLVEAIKKADNQFNNHQQE